jgi:hypothetical chaperone protein
VSFHEAGIDIDEPLAREEFEALIAPDVARIRRCVEAVLAAAGLRAGDIGAVFATGGSAQIPAIRSLLGGLFGAERVRSQDFLTTVACGLALDAA